MFIIALIMLLLGTANLIAGDPEWTSLAPQRSSSSLILSCEGTGPARDIALRLARDQCISMASDQISGTFHVQSLSVETQRDSGFHQEVSADRRVEGLVCQIEKQHVEFRTSTYHTWVQCRFSLKGVRTIPHKASYSPPEHLTGEDRSVILVTVPQCDDLVIRGKVPRLVPCQNNPMALFIQANDRELIIRSKGYLPKHVNAAQLGGTYEVYLDKL